MADEAFGAKAIAIVVGGLALLGLLIWQSIRFWLIYAREGGTGPLVGGIVCTLLAIGAIVLAVKMTM